MVEEGFAQGGPAVTPERSERQRLPGEDQRRRTAHHDRAALILQSTGDARVDQALCSLMIRRSRWAPARDRQGNPISVRVRYTATWSKD